MSEWISVLDELPSNNKIVDVYCGANRRVDVQYIGKNSWWDTRNAYFIDEVDITHWMPLPESPWEES